MKTFKEKYRELMMGKQLIDVHLAESAVVEWLRQYSKTPQVIHYTAEAELEAVLDRPSPPQGAGDSINHPSHYNSHPSGVECITVVEHFNFSIGNAIKYLWRCGLKGNEIEDLKKALWYVQREIDKREREGK